MNPLMNPLVRLTFKKHKAMSEARTALATAPLFLTLGLGLVTTTVVSVRARWKEGQGSRRETRTPVCTSPDYPIYRLLGWEETTYNRSGAACTPGFGLCTPRKMFLKVVARCFRLSSLRRRHARQRAAGRAGRRAQWEVWYFDHA